ncbi:protein FAM32A-like [Rana temporaria]|uniref:protein FAM32A-like n=1 Tax=Rana temporaria TaxID=8407 RepID=UPI001AAC7FFD|nr:protein FAM32A-like [Rana temporaria]
MSEYSMAQKGPLKLKGAGELSVGKKKKKKNQDKNKLVQQMMTSKKNEEGKKKPALDKNTPAQIAFEKIQEKRQMERMLKKATKTHKQRVEDFNRHLDKLTEHYDNPKVNWTK